MSQLTALGHAHEAAHPRATRVQLVLAPLCIVAAGAAFAAELIVGNDATTFGALSVVPVLAASLLRSRPLTLIVASFAMLLQIWGVGLGAVSRNAAGMQISVYMLTLAVAALQQSRTPVLEALDRAAEPEVELPLMHVPGAAVASLPMPVAVDAGTAALPQTLAATLTRRERDVVQLAAQGLTARQIGSLLFIGERTVETHLANAYGKLGVRSKVELIRLVSARSEDPAEIRTGTEAAKRATA